MRKFPIALIAAAALGAPAAASATPTVDVDPITGDVVYQTTSGDDTFGGAQRSYPPLAYRFGGPAAPGAGCVAAPHNTVDCEVAPGATTQVYARAGNDEINLGDFPDSLTQIFAGPGDDLVNANGLALDVHGADGIDRVAVDGTDGVISGGPGDDIVSARTQSTTVSGNDGDDFLTLNVAGGVVDVNGGTGADAIVQLADPGGTIRGGDDADLIAFDTPGSISTTGSAINGNGGDDRIYGSIASDTVSGGADDDVIATFGDGQADAVDCNGGADVAYVDAIDTVAHCETVVVGAPPADAALDAAVAAANTNAWAAPVNLVRP